ncbi:MAG: amidase [Pseudohongiellaceae bacterium]|nr:amidase [Pseudohongiellaceae bacterium]
MLIMILRTLKFTLHFGISLALGACHSAGYFRAQQAVENGASVTTLQLSMRNGEFNAQQLTQAYLDRIDRYNSSLNAVLETNPQALEIARTLDAERNAGTLHSPLHGIPVLIKDNIDTADQMQTSAGSLALLASPKPKRDAQIVSQLRSAGAIILGKTNLSEWANFRSSNSSSGWSARGGQTHNPYSPELTPCGSSSGSAVAIAASLATLAIGTETNGSIICPAAHNSIVGLKPTLGLVSQDGIIPIAHSQDTAGPMTGTVADAATLLSILAINDNHSQFVSEPGAIAHPNYTQYLSLNALDGKRIGVMRQFFGLVPELDVLMEEQLAILQNAGAELIDISIRQSPTFNQAQLNVLAFEFKHDINRYLSTRGGPVNSLERLIEFNNNHFETEQEFFGQELFEYAQSKEDLGQSSYLEALEHSQAYSRNALSSVLEEHQLDALVAPSNSPGWKINPTGDNTTHYVSSGSLAAAAGFPSITVPAGYIEQAPIGLSFIGGPLSEPVLIGLAYAYEQISDNRQAPPL